ncbi:unnamed protein product, partial [Coregonus sp. 'balchen']
VLEAQVSVDPQVTGYLGNDVTLRCELLQGNLTQAEWQWENSDSKKVSIAIFSPFHGQIFFESPLKGRLEFAGASITIKYVEMTDAGKYICLLTALWPSGSFEITTILTVLGVRLYSTPLSALDLVYSEIVRFNIAKSKAHDTSGEDQKDADVKPAEDVTYSAVAVGNQHPLREDTVYSQVVRKDRDID